MEALTSHDTMVMFLALGTLLLAARVLGELAMRFNQPAVVGEILAGVILGPTVMGAIAPDFTGLLFPAAGSLPLVLDGFSILAITLFLLVAGIEVDLSVAWRQGRSALIVGILGIACPFALGFAAAWAAPQTLGAEAAAPPLIFALFFATALSISALPVIARTLMDLNLYRSDLGMLVVAAAIFNDLVGWIIFAFVLGMIPENTSQAHPVLLTISLTIAFTAFMLTAGRWLIHRSLPWVQAHTTWPSGVLGLSLGMALLGGALTEWIGVHAIFGALLVGVAIGDSAHLREHTRTIISHFISCFFAPLFFASIGLRVNFVQQFDLFLVLTVLAIACLGKIVGCTLGARYVGISRREAWAVGFGMNARGAMEIIIGLLALQYGLIGERMFVALVVMALVTSLISGPAMQRLLGLAKHPRLSDFVLAKAFLHPLQARKRFEVIDELAAALCATASLDPAPVQAAARQREELMPTGMGNQLAVPHARVEGLTLPLVAVGLSATGVDFDAPDGEPARIIFLILTPLRDNGTQIAILAEIARIFATPQAREKVLQVKNYTEFLAILKTERK
ncbi:MAG: PTS transporter subunit EIIA [Phycisphaerae bacterium]|nr:PTS transporter subunit EIIA [Phycisphaerae bacterium]